MTTDVHVKGCSYIVVQVNPHEMANLIVPQSFGSVDNVPNQTSEKNLLRLGYSSPYRKPTQVVEMSILRRSGEPRRRN